MMDDKIAQIRSITDCSLERAVELLDECEGNLESAIDRFLSVESSEYDDDQQPSSSGSNSSAAPPRKPVIVDDEESIIRAPIASKSGVLVEDTFERSYAPAKKQRKQPNSVFTKLRDFEAETKEREASIFGAKKSNKNNSSSNGSGGVDNKRKTLEALFRPPIEIMHRGNLESAKSSAVTGGRWLLVNVQKTEEFSCQVLNRDVWNNGAVREIVESNFVLWQIYNDSAEGQRFETYYRVTGYPFLCILDPRTGEMLQSLKTCSDPVAFCDSVSSFLDRTPSFLKQQEEEEEEEARTDRQLADGMDAVLLAGASTIPKIGSKLPDNNSNNSNGRKTESSNKRPRALVEDGAELLEMEPPKPKLFRAAEDEDSSSGVSTASSTTTTTSSTVIVPAKATTAEVDDDRSPQLRPIDGSCSRLMFRMPDGRKRYRDVPTRTTVQDLLSHAETEWGVSAAVYDFVMNFPFRNLNNAHPDTRLDQLDVQKRDVVYIEDK